MNPDVKAILAALPRKVDWSDVAQFECMDDRVLTADYFCGDIIDVGEGYVQWCPNSDPPSDEERWMWWWVIRPDLGAAIAYEATDEMREVIAYYIGERHRPAEPP